MKGKSLLTLLMLPALHVYGQGEDAHAILNINQIEARVNGLGDLWADVATEQGSCIYPAGTAKNLAYAGALWMSGYDDGGNLHVAAQTYRQNGLDYKAGPQMVWLGDDAAWRKVWSVTRTDINHFLSLPEHTMENTPAAILDWPAKNNPYAKDHFGNPLTVTGDMAPFVDANGNGSYDPLTGDYPAIKGDQMLWHVYNDVRVPHGESHGTPLMMLVKQSVYGYNAGTLIDNVVYYEYELTNHAATDYTDFRLGFFADFDLGNAFDDYLGFDTTYRIGLAFNGSPTDLVYGSDIPAVGMALMEAPGDAFGALQPVGSFATYSNDFSLVGNPENAGDFVNYMQGKSKAGVALHHDSIYRVDLTLAGGSSYECLSSAPTYDLRFVLTAPVITFPAGATRKYAYAMVVAPAAGGCPTVDLTGLAAVTDTALYRYYHQPALGINATDRHYLVVYPNPAQTELYVNDPGEIRQLSISNQLGQISVLPYRQANGKLIVDVAALPAGHYILSVAGKNQRQHAPFIKR